MRYAEFHDLYTPDGEHEIVIGRAEKMGIKVIDLMNGGKANHDSPVLYWTTEGGMAHYALETDDDLSVRHLTTNLFAGLNPELKYAGSF